MNKIAILEGILFAVGSEGITLEELSNVLEISVNEVKILMKNLNKEYESDLRGIKILYLGEVFKLTTKVEHKEYYEKLIGESKNTTLSNAALETLAIIAYNEPITRIEVNNLRGIESSYTIRTLIARDLIKVSGKSKLPGRPNLYRTTKLFLDYFGLANIKDLPPLKEEKITDKEVDLYESTYKDL